MPPGNYLTSDIRLLIRQLEEGNRAALSRLLTLATANDHNASFPAALASLPRSTTPVIALTGSGGVGKSSLLGVLAAHFAQRGERVGVLACDPESPITGGALLGDRCRIAGDSVSERFFIRSLATGSGQQGIARNIDTMLQLMKAFGFNRVFVETVGAGQGDVAVRTVADVVVLVLQPHTGDILQWEKAGILEIADIIVINKADLPGADQTVADVTQQMQASGGPGVPVVKTSVAHRVGLEEFCRIIEMAPNQSPGSNMRAVILSESQRSEESRRGAT